MHTFQAPDTKLFFSKKDPQDQRLGDLVKLVEANSPNSSLTAQDFVILGYPDDRGIGLNGGRLGACQAPTEIRRHLYKMTPHLERSASRFYDGGDLILTSDLKEDHTRASLEVEKYLKANSRVLTLGGGHDYGFCDGSAFLKTYQNQKPLVINFDAHLDVRPSGFHSGTPFFRLLESFAVVVSGFDFAEVGIQPQCNAKSHFDWALSKGARVVTLDEIQFSDKGFVSTVLNALDPWLIQKRPTYISIDIDGFSNAYAMGCSQSFATGFEVGPFMVLLDILLKRLDVRILGIYEVSPPLDLDHRTSKLAALLAHRFLF